MQEGRSISNRSTSKKKLGGKKTKYQDGDWGETPTCTLRSENVSKSPGMINDSTVEKVPTESRTLRKPFSIQGKPHWFCDQHGQRSYQSSLFLN